MKNGNLMLLFGVLVVMFSFEGQAKDLKIGVMPKLIGIEYFNACEKGAREAAKELGVEMIFDGPDTNDVSRQTAIVETWIARKFDVIAIAPNDPDAIAPALKKARQRGVKVITWDSDSAEETRDYFINQADNSAIARTLMDVLVEGIGPEGKYLNLTGSLTAANQNRWMEEMEKYRQEKYPNLKNLSETPKASGEDQALATQVTIDSLKSYPDLQGIIAITSVALPGAAEALRKTQSADKIFLTGLSTPNSMRPYIKDGTVKKMVLWNPVDLGYLTVYTAKLLAEGKISGETIEAGRLGNKKIRGSEILLGDPLIFDAGNIDQFNF
ncbi:MAG: substrate-binding domain-containing protein [Candidatus Omnitrophica bacterium]|nr:substrate-binding domain-containing protein [Candidatus Omnitrophota bacterium]